MRRAQKQKVILMAGNLIGCMCLKELNRIRRVEVVAVIGLYHDNGFVVNPRAWNASLLRVALDKKMTFMQPQDLECVNFLDDLFEMDQPDYIIAAQYEHDLTPRLSSYPKKGCINLDFSLVPFNGNAHSASGALIDNDRVGVRMHWLDKKHSENEEIASKKIDIGENDTALSLYHRLTTAGFRLFKEQFALILQNKLEQNGSNGYDSLRNQQNSKFNTRNIDWQWEASKIDRMVRALTFPESPSARTFYNDLEIEILNPVEVIHQERNGHKPGQIVDISPNGLMVQTTTDCILIPKIRLNQSLVMNATKFCRYFNLSVGDIFQQNIST
ncbi:hypothetical protein GF337_14525 [candidate division KSB1 bacterium]|nr:hypothetical protein [candidate division KSB1 bacterium]